PAITITNTSAGPDLASCVWWYRVTDPSGTNIHAGTSASPDKTGVWASLVVPDVWPEPFGRINFSGSSYVVELSVKDGAGQVYNLEKSVDICKPVGLNENAKNNFGGAKVNLDLRCNSADIIAVETSIYRYKGNCGVEGIQVDLVVYTRE